MEYLNPAAEYLESIGATDLANQVRGYVGPQDMEAEWRRQTDIAIALRFWEEGYNDSESYRNSIPKFIEPSDKRLAFPLSIDPRISSSRKLALAGIKTYIKVEEIKDEIETPDVPYTVNTTPPILVRGYYVRGYYLEALKQIPDYGIGATADEVFESYLKLFSKYPQFFDPWADSGNSFSGAGRVPCLDVFRGRPEVSARWAEGSDGYWRVLSRGKKIGT